MRKSGAIVCLSASLAVPVQRAQGEDRPTPTYTDEDLARVAPLRGETGVLSTSETRAQTETSPEPARKGEAYWRKEAERLRTRLRPLKRRAEDLRRRLEEAASAERTRPPKAG